jgi:hypothetical protein
MTRRRKTLSEVIDDLEESGRLDARAIEDLRTAPSWWVAPTELLAFLGGAIAIIGLVWTLGALFPDLSLGAIDAGLYVLSVVTGVAVWFLHGRGPRLERLVEVLLAVTTGLFATAVGVSLHLAGTSTETGVWWGALLAFVAGIVLIPRTTFIGTVITVVAAQPLTAVSIALAGVSEPWGGLFFVASGAVLYLVGTRDIGLSFAARGVGAMSIVISLFNMAVYRDDIATAIASLIIAGLIFAVGARKTLIETLIAGGIGTTLSVGALAAQLFDSEVLQGTAVLVCGVTLVTLSLAQLRGKQAG